MRQFTGKMPRMRLALLLTATALILRLPTGMLLRWLLPGVDANAATYDAALIFQECLLWLGPALMLHAWPRQVRHDRTELAQAGLAVLGGVSAQYALAAVTDAWCSLVGCAPTWMPLPQNGAAWVLAVLALVIVPAVAEELFFRGGLYRALAAGAGTRTALVLTTLIFGLMHGSLAGLPSHLAVSALCTLLMWRTGRVELCVLMHLAYNGAALVGGAGPGLSVVMAPVLIGFALWLVRGGGTFGEERPLAGWDTALCVLILAGTLAMYLPDVLRVIG